MKTPYTAINRLCDMAEKIANDNYDEMDFLAVQKVRSWLTARAKRLQESAIKAIKRRKEKRLAYSMKDIEDKLKDEGVLITSVKKRKYKKL